MIIRRFPKSEQGTSSIEFALIFPVLAAMMLSVIEYSHYITVTRRADYASQFFAEYLSRDADNQLTNGERIQAQESWGILNPHLNDPDDSRRAGARTHAYGYASVDFEKADPDCEGSDCELAPNVHWTFYGGSYRGIQGIRMSCDPEIVANSVEQDGTNIPEGMVGRTAIIMTDIVYRYEPILAGGLLPTFEQHVSSVRKTRSGLRLDYRNRALRRSGHLQDCP
ncbi:MAG: pilus assembly protein [Aquisalinus sp.]|nr:pilus assembly protein [Aquisalinus sp.]